MYLPIFENYLAVSIRSYFSPINQNYLLLFSLYSCLKTAFGNLITRNRLKDEKIAFDTTSNSETTNNVYENKQNSCQ